MRDLKSLLIIILCFLLPLIACVYFGWDADTELNNDTLKEVEKLRWKHCGLNLTDCDVNVLYFNGIKWTRNFLSIWVENDKLFVETQDGKWFIEMTNANK